MEKSLHLNNVINSNTMIFTKGLIMAAIVAAVGLVGLNSNAHTNNGNYGNSPKSGNVSSVAGGLGAGAGATNSAGKSENNSSDNAVIPQVAGDHKPVCPGSQAGDSARCFARVIVDQLGTPKVTSVPVGYTSVQLRGAYGVATNTNRMLIAIVDAYDQPNIFSDVNTYSSRTGIVGMANGNASTGACSITSGTSCFKKIDQNGGTNYPSRNTGWGQEISLDVEVAHAMCPTCNILLVEAKSASFTDLNAAISKAVALGAKIVSNSWGANEFSGETSLDSVFSSNPTVAFTFSSGDSGYSVGYPAASPYVVSVGGTSLNISAGNVWASETVWSGTGGGCSLYENKPAFQTGVSSIICAKRMTNDVSADANPNTGAAVYDSAPGAGGWLTFGGTSLSSPIIAAIYAMSGQSSFSNAPSIPYAHTSNLHDVTSGSNGSCGGSYLCTALSGYDGPTGFGTPNGTSAF